MKKLYILLLSHKRKVFLSSIIILTITIINFADEVIIGGQGLYSSPEELFGWIIGFCLGIGGLVFVMGIGMKKNHLIIASVIITILHFYYFIKVRRIDRNELKGLDEISLGVGFLSIGAIAIYILCFNLFFIKKRRFLAVFIALIFLTIERMLYLG